MRKDARITAFTVSELLRKPKGEGGKIPPPTPPPKLGLRNSNILANIIISSESRSKIKVRLTWTLAVEFFDDVTSSCGHIFMFIHTYLCLCARSMVKKAFCEININF